MRKLYFVMAALIATSLNLKAETYVTGDVFGGTELYIPQHVSTMFGEVEKGLSFVKDVVATSDNEGYFILQETAFQPGEYVFHVKVGDTFYVATYANYSEFSPARTAEATKMLTVKSIINNKIEFEVSRVKK